MSLSNLANRRPNSSRGQTMTEYALIIAAIAAVLIALYTEAGTIVTTLISQVGPLL